MESLEGTLYDRVDELIRSHKDQEPVLSTVGPQALIDILIARTEALEQAVREIAVDVGKLTAQGQR